jgi:hypothetical protein
LGGGWEAEWREDSVVGGALQVEIHNMAIRCVCGVGGWDGYSPRFHGRRDRAGRDCHAERPHVPLLRLVYGFPLLVVG